MGQGLPRERLLAGGSAQGKGNLAVRTFRAEGFLSTEVAGDTSRIAAIQMVSGPDVTANLAVASDLVARAAAAGARLVALPEYFAIMGLRDTDKLSHAERPGSGPIQDCLAGLAARHGVWLVGVSIPLAAPVPGRVYNASILYAPSGKAAARYDKIHLFGLDLGQEQFSEARTILPGHCVVTAATDVGRVGLSICYDLRFPELYRAMGLVDLIVVPSAFTATTGAAHWEVLLRSRAIENQAYVLAPAQGGLHPSGRRTHGHTLVVDPWGSVLAVQDTDPGVVVAELKLSEVSRVRQALPAQRHRRLGAPE